MHKKIFIGHFVGELYRGEKLITRVECWNDIVTEGKNYILDTFFGRSVARSQITPWYIGLINNTPTPTLLAADTLASHSGWAELVPGTDYSGDRKEWVDADAASGAKTTTTAATFNIAAACTIWGGLLCSVASGTSGILWATGKFTTATPCNIGDVFKATYAVSF